MYARETVTDQGTDTRGQLQVLRKALREQLNVDLNPPDLSAQGLTLVRAQRLHFEGRTVLQLVYLPPQGMPLALCLMQAPSQPERSFVQEGQQALSWHAGGWTHVLIGSLPPERMQAIRRQLPASALQPRAIG
jgi:anti-sigma factor RsiW